MTKRIGKETRAFTLIERLVVVLIIGILAAIALPRYQQAIYRSRFMTIIPVVKAMAQSAHAYYLEHGNYTTNIFAYDFQYPECNSSQTAWCETDSYAQFRIYREPGGNKNWWVQGAVKKSDGESINSYRVCLDCNPASPAICGARSNNKKAEKVCTSLGGVKIPKEGGHCIYNVPPKSWCGFYTLPW